MREETEIIERSHQTANETVATMPRMKSKIQETLRVLKTLQSQFRLLLPTSFQSSQLAVDLADIHEICRSYLSRINDLMKSDVGNRRQIEDVFYEIDCDLFEHLPYHLKSLNKIMPQVKRAIQQPSRGKQLLLGSKERRGKNGSRPRVSAQPRQR